jgi:hypothetical protein
MSEGNNHSHTHDQAISRIVDQNNGVTDMMAIADLFLRANRLVEQVKFLQSQMQRASAALKERDEKIKSLEERWANREINANE